MNKPLNSVPIPKGGKQVVKSHISDKQLMTKHKALVEQLKRIALPQPINGQLGGIRKYNLMVMGMQNCYDIATNINVDASKLNRAVMTVITNRLKGISKKGCELTPSEKTRYGKSAMLRYLADEPIYPIGYVRHKIPMNTSGKVKIEKIGELKHKLLHQPLYGRSIEYVDNRISLYAAQKGRCAVTGEKFTSTDQIHCHHKVPRLQGGTDDYQNLILVTSTAHKLIHATKSVIIKKCLKICKPDVKKLNVLRKLVGNDILTVD